MKGAKLYKVELWQYPDGPGDIPEQQWPGPPSAKIVIPDCESAEVDYFWENAIFQSPTPLHLSVHGVIKTYDHQFAQYLASRYPVEDYMVIGDCLLLYYRTDDGQEWLYRFNGVYFGGNRTMRLNSTEEVDTGESEHSLLTWRLARFHHGNDTSFWSNWSNRVTLVAV